MEWHVGVMFWSRIKSDFANQFLNTIYGIHTQYKIK